MLGHLLGNIFGFIKHGKLGFFYKKWQNTARKSHRKDISHAYMKWNLTQILRAIISDEIYQISSTAKEILVSFGSSFSVLQSNSNVELFVFSLMYVWINSWRNSRVTGGLRPHDAIVTSLI